MQQQNYLIKTLSIYDILKDTGKITFFNKLEKNSKNVQKSLNFDRSDLIYVMYRIQTRN
jgi:hypothetical protein